MPRFLGLSGRRPVVLRVRRVSPVRQIGFLRAVKASAGDFKRACVAPQQGIWLLPTPRQARANSLAPAPGGREAAGFEGETGPG